MFDPTFVDIDARTRRPWTVAASLAGQTGFVAVLLILPLLHPEVPHVKFETPVHVAVLPLTTQSPPAAKPDRRAAQVAPRPVFSAPARVPAHIGTAKIIDATLWPDVPIAGPDSAAGTSPVSVFNLDLPEGFSEFAPSVKPVPAPPAGPLRVGIGVQSAKLIFGPKPHFSPIAIAAHIQGTVKIQAIIAADGSIRNLRVMSGPPLLAGLALDAVKQWRYQPTLLNGAPVEVITEIDVVFTLTGN